MAYTKRQEETEHPSRTIVRVARENSWPKAIMLFGRETFLVEWSKNYIISNTVNPAARQLDCTVFSESGFSAQDIIFACETPAILSEKKVVAVSDYEPAAEEGRQLAEYIPRIPDGVLLLIAAEKPNKNSPVFKACAKHGMVWDFTPLPDSILGPWMAKRMKMYGREADVREMISFARACGYGDTDRNYNLFSLENDIKKAVALTDSKTLVYADFAVCSSAQEDVNVFRLLDSAFSGRKSAAFRILNSIIDKEQPSKEIGAVLSFTGLLISQLEIMTEAAERAEEGQTFSAIVKAMGVNEYRLKKAVQASGGKSAADLRKSLDGALQIEKDLKNGSMDARLSLELFISEL